MHFFVDRQNQFERLFLIKYTWQNIITIFHFMLTLIYILSAAQMVCSWKILMLFWTFWYKSCTYVGTILFTATNSLHALPHTCLHCCYSMINWAKQSSPTSCINVIQVIKHLTVTSFLDLKASWCSSHVTREIYRQALNIILSATNPCRTCAGAERCTWHAGTLNGFG